MAQRRFNLNLKEARFPFVSDQRSVGSIIPNLDQGPVPPQIYWLENVIPTAEGYGTVSYTPTVSGNIFPETLTDPELLRSNIFVVQSKERTTSYLAVYGTKHYLFDIPNSTWNLVATSPNADGKVSVFFFQGQSWIFISGLGVFNPNADCTDYVEVTIEGLNLAQIVYFSAANNYLVAISQDTFFWSSPLNPVYFSPDGEGADANAGSTKIASLRGTANILVPSPKGTIIYTTVNAVEATYTGNSAVPFRFVEVLNSSGVFWPEHVTGENNAGMHFLWSDTGLSRVSQGAAQMFFPDASDFLTGTVFEFLDEDDVIQKRDVSGLEVNIRFVTNRYLAISYGRFGRQKDFILLYDLVLERWGKLSIPHVSVFNLNLPSRPEAPDAEFFDDNVTQEAQDFPDTYAYQLIPGNPEENFRAAKFGVLRTDGALVEVNLADMNNNVPGKIILGGMQLTRNRFMEILDVRLTGNMDLENCDVAVSGRLDTNQFFDWEPMEYSVDYERYYGGSVAKEFKVMLSGPMHIVSAELNAAVLGTE